MLAKPNCVGSRPLRARPLKANDPTLSILISASEVCQKETFIAEGLTHRKDPKAFLRGYLGTERRHRGCQAMKRRSPAEGNFNPGN
jgi:hypothetical protein